MNDNKGCIGCYLRVIKNSNGRAMYQCNRPFIFDRYICPCTICLIKGMCKTECKEFIDYNRIVGYEEDIEEE